MIALATPEVEATDLISTVSASRLNTFHSCRLKYFWRYVERVKAPSTPALHTGKAFHDALRQFNLGRWKGTPCSNEELHEGFLEYWASEQNENPVEWGEDEDRHRDKAWSLVTAYLEQNPVPVNEAVEGVEVRLEMQLPEHPTTLVGIVDLIRGGSGSILVEYKTAAQTTNPKLLGIKHQTQLTAYSLLFEDAVGHEPAELQIHSVIKVKSPHVTTTRLPASNQRQKDQFFRAVDSWANGVSDGDWVASPGLQCAGCPYFARCLEHGGHQ